MTSGKLLEISEHQQSHLQKRAMYSSQLIGVNSTVYQVLSWAEGTRTLRPHWGIHVTAGIAENKRERKQKPTMCPASKCPGEKQGRKGPAGSLGAAGRLEEEGQELGPGTLVPAAGCWPLCTASQRCAWRLLIRCEGAGAPLRAGGRFLRQQILLHSRSVPRALTSATTESPPRTLVGQLVSKCMGTGRTAVGMSRRVRESPQGWGHLAWGFEG